ncbi:GSCFA domain-containing protein [Donghicola mangrovi]|uniref:GSCFA domain-containing protein n=1 Tax=Donghicola mangrovi TaxID=2729614 RepID=A0A850QCW0_9RHOB|nr:GSCFA domain-containing protein [Donghicola mangrovi]NVO24778.1 GSCFA domain-containing protein [Donghicola mangrovi]
MHPYISLPRTAFWRTGVAEAGLYGLSGLWKSPWTLPRDAQFATYGSCFAQHISRALKERNIGWVNGEPAPGDTPKDLAKSFNYGVFSARTANIYTAAQLRLLLQMAVGDVPVREPELWQDQAGGFRDSLRPMIEPTPFRTEEAAIVSRAAMVRGLRKSVQNSDVFVFTLGLTEGWENTKGQPYAACPGTIGGTFDPEQHVFVNYRAAAIREALDDALVLLKRLNPDIHLLLTVSPVPLTATASGQHVLVATTRSKSVLRGVAGEIAEDFAEVDYFPSYEIIAGAPTRSSFFAPNMRSVELAGVKLVMRHFFGGLNLTGPSRHDTEIAAAKKADAALEQSMAEETIVCEEAILESYNEA